MRTILLALSFVACLLWFQSELWAQPGGRGPGGKGPGGRGASPGGGPKGNAKGNSGGLRNGPQQPANAARNRSSRSSGGFGRPNSGTLNLGSGKGRYSMNQGDQFLLTGQNEGTWLLGGEPQSIHPRYRREEGVKASGKDDAVFSGDLNRPEERPNWMSETQQQNLNQLRADLAGIREGSNVTPEQKNDLKNSLMTLADGATKSSAASVEALSSSLQSALADQTLTNLEKAQLASCVQEVLNSANIPPDEVSAVIEDARAILESADVSEDEIQQVVNDLKSIAAELKNRGK